MPNITKINSGKGLVSFSMQDLADLDIAKWVRSDSHGVGHRKFIAIQPIEKAAAKVYNEKFPSVQVKLAEKCFLRQDGSVDVILRVAQEVSEGNYNTHPTKMTFSGEAHTKESSADLEATFNEVKLEEDGKKKVSGLSLPIDFIEEHIQDLNDDEKRQIFSELGNDNNAGTFLRDLKMAMIDSSTSIEKLAAEVEDIDEEEEYSK